MHVLIAAVLDTGLAAVMLLAPDHLVTTRAAEWSRRRSVVTPAIDRWWTGLDTGEQDAFIHQNLLIFRLGIGMMRDEGGW